MNTYIPDKEINEWVEENSETIFTDIVIAAEGIVSGAQPLPATICRVRTDIGFIDFLIKEKNDVLNSLKKAETWFAECEIYSMAAKARDLQKIYKQNNL